MNRTPDRAFSTTESNITANNPTSINDTMALAKARELVSRLQ
jgi:hypothetical protein